MSIEAKAATIAGGPSAWEQIVQATIWQPEDLLGGRVEDIEPAAGGSKHQAVTVREAVHLVELVTKFLGIEELGCRLAI